MSELSSRIIVDVTQLVHWPGKLTGIPRVMHELGMRFGRQHSSSTIFVSWVKDVGAYCEIDFPKTMAQRGDGLVYLGPNETTPPYTERFSSTLGASQATVKRSFVKRAVRVGLVRTRRLSPKLATMLEARARSVARQAYKQVQLTKNDIVFISWGEWWDSGFIDMLIRAKKDQGVKIAQVIHDLGPILTPQFSSHSTESLTDYCTRVVPICDLVCVVSQSARREITGWLKAQKLSIPRIEAFRLGDDFRVSKPAPPRDPQFKAAGLRGQDYIMMVGTVELRKNHMLFYYVYRLAKERGIKLPKLIVVGRMGWKTEITYDLITQDLETKDDILFFKDTSDEEMSWLYDHCLFTVHSAFYEGWGIPVAESIARGVPCLCTNADSVREIAGDDVLIHYSASSTDECLAGIQRLSDPKILADARRSTKQYKQTSWDDSFKQVYGFIKEI